MLTRRFLVLFLAFAPLVAGRLVSADEYGKTAVETFDRVWEIVRDTHFDPDLNGIDWQAVHEELRPEARNAGNVGELRRAIQKMLARLGQSHFALIPAESENGTATADERALEESLAAVPPFEGRATPGIDVRLLEGRAVVWRLREGHPADRAGVKTGWEITAIGGQPFEDSLRFAAREMKSMGMEEVFELGRSYFVWSFVRSKLSGDEGTEVEVEFADGSGSRKTLSLRREPLPCPLEATGGMPPLPVEAFAQEVAPSISAIRIPGMWLLGTVQAFDRAFAGARTGKGMILDLRGNLGGVSMVGQSVAGALFSSPEQMGVFVTRGGEIPLPVTPRKVAHGDETLEPYQGPLAILIDGLSGSTTEFFTAALQDLGRARIFGEPSSGAVLPSQVTPLPNGDKLLHAIADYYRPRGGSLEGNPVQPDEAVPLTRAALLDGRDAAMEAAIRWIHEQSERQVR